MDKKSLIRKKYFLKRKKKFFEISDKFFLPLINLIKKRGISKKAFISLYYPSSFEVDVLKILKVEYFKKFNFLLPIIQKNKSMEFYKWKHNEILYVNKYGIPEPTKTIKIIPSIMLVPLLAFDKDKNRLGYGKGYYDKYLFKYIKTHKHILTVGIAFSFQKYNKLPVNKKDFKLNFIITEKGII
jgi:5-formyltetrahydrofolate cyclo-ligase